MNKNEKEQQVCPICGGKGWVHQDFYNPPPDLYHVRPSTTGGDPRVTCKACGGIGVIVS